MRCSINHPIDEFIKDRENVFMFLRTKPRIKDGKTHRYWGVVENRRVASGGVVQQQMIYLWKRNDKNYLSPSKEPLLIFQYGILLLQGFNRPWPLVAYFRNGIDPRGNPCLRDSRQAWFPFSPCRHRSERRSFSWKPLYYW